MVINIPQFIHVHNIYSCPGKKASFLLTRNLYKIDIDGQQLAVRSQNNFHNKIEAQFITNLSKLCGTYSQIDLKFGVYS